MGKRGKNQIRGNRNQKKMNRGNNDGMEDMDDEIDVFHKHRDKVSLDVHDDVGDTDEDEELAVFDYKDIHEDEEEEDEDEDEDDDDHPNSLVKKIQRTQKLLKAKHGDLGDDMLDDTEDKEVEHAVWSTRKSLYYDGDNADYELQSSDEDSAQEEEAEVIRLRKEAATSMTVEDVGIEESDESDIEPTLEEMLIKGKDASGFSQKKEIEDDLSVPYEMVKKDLNSLSRDEAMDVVYSSAPELVGLLSELNDALQQLENSVNPLLVKVQNVPVKKEGSQYLEVKKQLLLAYCQAITFYLLLKSEGQPVRDHPVIARLVEIKSLLDKMKELDVNLPSQLEELLEDNKIKLTAQSAVKNSTALSDLVSKMKYHERVSAVELEASKLEREEPQIMNISKDDAQKAEDVQTQNEKLISKQSLKMLSARAVLEEKLKQKGVFTSIEPGAQGTKRRKLQPLNSKLETFDDFDDDAMDADENPSELYGNAPTLSNRVSQYLSVKGNKTKVSGDDDLPKRDDLGERRRKYELQVLARAGVKSVDKDDDNGAEPVSEEDEGRNNADADVDVGSDESDKSEDEFYRQVKQQRKLRLAAKAQKFTRTPIAPQGPEVTVDGKRHITTQIEKNRGLTRNRKKLIKNPRKKYKLKHDKAMKRRAGQVRKVVRPEGPYSGEWTGINANISRSIRLSG